MSLLAPSLLWYFCYALYPCSNSLFHLPIVPDMGVWVT